MISLAPSAAAVYDPVAEQGAYACCPECGTATEHRAEAEQWACAGCGAECECRFRRSDGDGRLCFVSVRCSVESAT